MADPRDSQVKSAWLASAGEVTLPRDDANDGTEAGSIEPDAQPTATETDEGAWRAHW